MGDYILCGFSTSSHKVHVSVNGVVPYMLPVEVFMTGVTGQHVLPSNYPPRHMVLGPDVPPDSWSQDHTSP